MTTTDEFRIRALCPAGCGYHVDYIDNPGVRESAEGIMALHVQNMHRHYLKAGD